MGTGSKLGAINDVGTAKILNPTERREQKPDVITMAA